MKKKDHMELGSLGQLFENIREVWKILRKSKQRDWNRTLPFGEYFVDRWEKASELGFGKGASIYDSAVVMGEVKVGENTWVGLMSFSTDRVGWS